MYIEAITLYHVRLQLKTPVTTSFGTIKEKDAVLVEVRDRDGISGWGEAPVFAVPWYLEETVQTVCHIMQDFLIPRLLGLEIAQASEVAALFAPIQRNCMAKAGIESAVWDLAAKKAQQSLASLVGGTRKTVPVGVVIGLQEKQAAALKWIERYLAEGYKKIKLKIKPGNDLTLVQAVRQAFPELPLAVDANGAYTLSDWAFFQELDRYGLTMIEQPLKAGDLIDHGKLQASLVTPLCLDESIATFADIQVAAKLGSCRVINVKMSRLGGIALAKQVHDFCELRNLPVWCGGMFETGIGRAHNIALASLSNFTLPGDLSASSRYWDRDIIEPEVIVRAGEIAVPEGPGIGYEVKRAELEKVLIGCQTYLAT